MSPDTHLDHERCARAVRGRDARFDGQFVTGVLTTGIYCRPSCPARTPRSENMRFYPSAAAAHREGFRACKRCLPDATPGSPAWNTRADAAARAVRLIEDGLLDRADVPALAAAVGYSSRQLERLLLAEVGSGPLGLARAQRAQTARTLIERTDRPLTEVAWAAGFSSIRSFNDTVRAVYGAAPRDLRARHTSPTSEAKAGYAVVPVRLPFRPPLETEQLFGHLAATAVPGVEEWDGSAYRRTFTLPRGHGILSVRPPSPGETQVSGELLLTDLRDLTAAVHRTRWLLDLDADPEAVDGALAEDPLLADLVAATPGRRVARTVDGSELALRLMIGQQVSTAAARTVTGRVVAAYGTPIEDPTGGLTNLFPSPATWADLPDDALPMPQSRREALRGLARALADGLDLGPGADWERTRVLLLAMPGIGPWTVEGIARRALGDPDAIQLTDLGVLAGARALGITDRGGLAQRAQRWRPWRAYAVQHLWSLLDHPLNTLPAQQETS